MTVTETDKKYIAGTYARFPVEIASGKGSVLVGTDGKEYIDMGSGIGVCAFGTADDEWRAAVEKQLDLVQHTSNLYYTEPCAKLAELMCTRSGMKKVFFCNSGAEANECAIKAARKYACEKKGEDYYTIITMKNSFHGRTITTLSATGQEHYHELFCPMTPGFVYAEPNDFDDFVRCATENKTAAVMLECIQGEGGVNVLNADFVSKVADYANKNDIIVIIDEVQTGNGRTGKLYSYMHYGIEPDVVTTAKGLGGGLPIGAAMLGERVENIFAPGDNGSTFGGNPVVCAGAYSILSRIDDAFLAEVEAKGEYVRRELSGAEGIKEVVGMGLMVGILTEKPAAEVVKQCIEKGVLCLTAKNKVRLLPPLNIPMEKLGEAVEIIKSVCKTEA